MSTPMPLNGITWDNNHWFCTSDSHGDQFQVDWCEHIRSMIEKGEDAVDYHLGSRIESVPIFPTNKIFVTVVIDREPVVARSGMMRMEFQPDIGTLRRIELGLWNPGEGMASMRAVIVDFIKSKLDPNEQLTGGPFKTRCPNNAHSLKSSRIMNEHRDEPGWKWTCLWNMVMERACTPCIEETNGTTDDNFGVDESVLPKPRWG